MSFENPDNSEFNPLAAFTEMLERRKKMEGEMRAMTEGLSEQLEKAVLMELWKQLGDHTETYFEALNGAHMFIEALTAVRDIATKSTTLGPIIMEALSQCCFYDAQVHRSMKGVAEKYTDKE